MLKYNFYVVSDLNSGHESVVEYFDDGATALARYLEMENSDEKLPALGIQTGDGGLDLIQGIYGENVLVRDYCRPGLVLSPEMQEAVNDISPFIEKCVLEGVAQREFLTVRLADSYRAIVPVTLKRDDYDDGYCENKVLKTTNRSGLDAIDSLFVRGHGWVVGSDLLAEPEKYCQDGFIQVDAINAVYIRDKNVTGLDGRMDVCPTDFAKMVRMINKPYALVVYDSYDYTCQYKGKHDYIVASYETLPEAVKAWYDYSDKHPDVPMYVGHQERGRESSVFNGVNNDFEKISRAEAAAIYGFEDEKSVNERIADAERSCAPQGESKPNYELDK